MTTKHYELTEIEILAIREALDKQWFAIKDRKMQSPIIKSMQKATKILLDPIAIISPTIKFSAPAPRDIIDTTAVIPIMIPSIVKKERALFVFKPMIAVFRV